LHMKNSFASYNGLGDFSALIDKIDSLEEEINEYILENREKNLQIKTALFAEVEKVKLETEWKETSEKMKELKQKWIKTGSAYKEQEDELSEKFNEAIEFFFEKRKNFFAEQAKVMNDRLRMYRNLIYKLKDINADTNAQIHIPSIKKIQEDWRLIGRVNKLKFGKLTSDFKREIEKFFYTLKLQKAASEKSGIELKKELFKDIQYILEAGVPFDIDRVKQIQGRWKMIGKLPEMEDREYNLKFRIACNEIFETHFLEKTAKTQFRDIYKKPFEEQIKIKISILQDSIARDRADLNDFDAQNGISPNVDPRSISDFNVLKTRNNYINKIKTKERVKQKLEEKLSFLY
jgi:glycerol-3-phosphate cytidylyltransferase-like family protein